MTVKSRGLQVPWSHRHVPSRAIRITCYNFFCLRSLSLFNSFLMSWEVALLEPSEGNCSLFSPSQLFPLFKCKPTNEPKSGTEPRYGAEWSISLFQRVKSSHLTAVMGQSSSSIINRKIFRNLSKWYLRFQRNLVDNGKNVKRFTVDPRFFFFWLKKLQSQIFIENVN